MTQTWTTTITKIDPIPGKDRIVLATVEGYQAITGNDKQVGDRVCYISDQSILPDDLIEELGARSYLAGAEHNRVKPMKMGGVLSQGIICQPAKWLDAIHVATLDPADGIYDASDHDDLLGVVKWSPVVPQHLSGKLARPRGNADIVAMYDVENIKKLRHWDYECHVCGGKGHVLDHNSWEWKVCDEDHSTGHWFDPFDGETVVVTEKIHGTNIGMHMNRDHDGELLVYSKGIGQNGWTLLEDDNNTYWNAVHRHPEVVAYMERCLRSESAVTVFGEVYGPGIQDLTYGVSRETPALAIFEIRFWDPGFGAYHMDASDIAVMNEAGGLKLPHVPVLYVGPYNYELHKAQSEVTSSMLHPDTLREGVVVVSRDHSQFTNGNRKIAKFINPSYLTRRNGSEFN